MQKECRRPKGVTIVAILLIVFGIFGLVNDIAVEPNYQVSKRNVNQTYFTPQGKLIIMNPNDTDTKISNNELSVIGSYSKLSNNIGIPTGVADLIVGVGLLKGKWWSWIGAIILALVDITFRTTPLVLGMSAGPAPGYLSGYVIHGVILWYLFRPNTKAYFGRVKVRAT